MAATIHHLSPNVDRRRLLQNALDTNSAGFFLMRLYFERLDCFGKHDSYAEAFELVTRAIRESVDRDKKLYEEADLRAQIQRLMYLRRIDIHMNTRENELPRADVVVKFPAKRIARRRKAERGAMDPTDQPFRFSKPAAAVQPAATQDREKDR